jgi:hypothetical protein
MAILSNGPDTDCSNSIEAILIDWHYPCHAPTLFIDDLNWPQPTLPLVGRPYWSPNKVGGVARVHAVGRGTDIITYD